MNQRTLSQTFSQSFVGRDPRYRFCTPIGRSRRAEKNNAQFYNLLRLTDRRTFQEREAAQFGSWYPFLCALRAEEANANRVAKAQATLRWRSSFFCL